MLQTSLWIQPVRCCRGAAHAPCPHRTTDQAICLSVQRYIVRIIFMVPMYSICSFPSLIHPNQAIYWNTVRDW